MEAIVTRNSLSINPKLIQVSPQQDDKEAVRADVTVFVKNLDSSIDNTKLASVFEKYGKIVTCKVQVFDNGVSKGYGYVQFETQESAQKAVEEANGCNIEGKEFYVCPFKKIQDRIQPEVGYTNLYVKNLDQDITEEIFREKFSGFGNITSSVIMKDSNGNSKGFGFVNFENPEDAKKAKDSMDGARLGSKVLYVARAQKKEERQRILQLQIQERPKGLNVYVKHINDNVNDDELKLHFEQCGKVISVRIMRDDKGFSKGFGFVSFSVRHEAERAIRTLHRNIFHGKPLYVSPAQTKEERQRYLQIKRQHGRGFPTYPFFQISSFSEERGNRYTITRSLHSFGSYQHQHVSTSITMARGGVAGSGLFSAGWRF